MGTKLAVAFANIYMASIEEEMLRLSDHKPLKWKTYVDDLFSLWDMGREEIDHFIKHANSFHPTIKFTAKASQSEIKFLETTLCKGERFAKQSILNLRTHYKPAETFQCTYYNSCHSVLVGIKKGFVKEKL